MSASGTVGTRVCVNEGAPPFGGALRGLSIASLTRRLPSGTFSFPISLRCPFLFPQFGCSNGCSSPRALRSPPSALRTRTLVLFSFTRRIDLIRYIISSKMKEIECVCLSSGGISPLGPLGFTSTCRQLSTPSCEKCLQTSPPTLLMLRCTKYQPSSPHSLLLALRGHESVNHFSTKPRPILLQLQGLLHANALLLVSNHPDACKWSFTSHIP